MQFLKHHASVHYKVQLRGHGLVALEWEAGVETEERVQCLVVAEKSVLNKTLDQRPQLFTLPQTVDVEVTFEEPQRLPNSDQLRYLLPKTIATRDLHTGTPSEQMLTPSQTRPKQKHNRGKRTLDEAKATSPAYRYSSLAGLVSGYADIYGVVVNVTLPKKSGGRDFVMTVSVMDESCPTRAEAMQINVFWPTIAQMPKIKYVGDIIRFHKVKIQEYQGRKQGLSVPRVTRYLVLRETADQTLEQLTCSETWTFEPSDEVRTHQLIKWAKKSLGEDTTLPPGCKEAPKLLSDLKHAKDFIDLVVRVLHLDDTTEPIRLIVWDGSGDVAESDPTLVRALRDNGTAVPANGTLKEVIMSSCWSVLRDIGFDDGMLTHWCRFRNLAVGTDEPIPGAATTIGRTEVLRFREVTSLVLLPEFVPDIQYRLSLATKLDTGAKVRGCQSHMLGPGERRLSNESQSFAVDSPVDVTTVIPDYIQKNVPTTSVREIIRSPQTPRKFHCCARARGIWPSDIEKICKPNPGKDGEFIYSFALTIQEGDDSLNVIVYGADAEHFLHGIPPCDLNQSTASKTLLTKRLAALLQAPQAFHWCIKSYSVSLPPDTKHSLGPTTAVRYRLFNTMLQCL
uniref:Telomeric single stranded DNA binding POT1/Cdc13 domain-containing protein n=1 Tax=Peronospora matthiolae TaxID=2874970 RepID=A0AAV1T566_9STRA